MSRWRTWLLSLVCLFGAVAGQAQTLLWEQSGLRAGLAEEGYMELQPTGAGQLLASGAMRADVPVGQPCLPNWRYLLQTWNLNGTLLQERLGPSIRDGGGLIASALVPATPGGRAASWWTTGRTACPPGATSAASIQGWGMLFPLTAGGDTLAGLTLPHAGLYLTVRTLLAHGRRVLVAGRAALTPVVNQQLVQNVLTCYDTTGGLLWQRTYPRLPQAYDFCSALVRVPATGGYLLSGDGITAAAGFQHLLTEVDSLGNLRRQRLLAPFGIPDGRRTDGNCNLLALPGGGYVASGTADSVSRAVGPAGGRWGVPYLLKVDTALQVVWTCRLAAGWGTPGVRARGAYRVRALADGSFAVLVGEGPSGLHLVRVSAQGRLVGHWVLASPGYVGVTPNDWQWLGDGTLVLGGQARLANDLNTPRAYLARWDLRGAALAAAAPRGAGAVGGALQTYPNPASGQVQVAASASGAEAAFELLDLSGRVVRTLKLDAAGQGSLNVAGLAGGVYVGRVPGRRALGTCKIVVLP